MPRRDLELIVRPNIRRTRPDLAIPPYLRRRADWMRRRLSRGVLAERVKAARN